MTSYSFKCRDIGMDCGFETSSNERDSLMTNIGNHAREAHNMETIPKEVLEKVQGAIKKW